ncbi:MAG: acyl-CoA dehydrogenase family protein [Candidatus Dormibacteraeota bacterium]|uniref:Acyl-CoA dehydrogenase family protein n=2 Tax=Candidatus Dormibacteria TaxID=3126996 RepID=A0A934JV63_9BACT|nr:acyl-CoA dehydrogenase family protein [Candidatus Dormibacteraeota bacterium]MBJ7601613.1 acyl-CoA dehydrogenase family protein [Candidatus Dormibacteraeota bacterium]MBJ7605551.1 acyl-CoA dehydrogenase family protein [Candidatus Dormibacteraeota bacterium]
MMHPKGLTTVLEKVRKLGPTLRERALEAERAGRHSDETIADLDATGAFKIGSPAEFGGDELSVRQQLDVVSEVAKWDGSCGWIVWVGASTNWIPAGSGARVVELVSLKARWSASLSALPAGPSAALRTRISWRHRLRI